ncbi:heme exporter protein CcmD [Azospirillum sp.]|uniref:heme exporter protein CcmD n=1 Tax=Azospirillum sp. TaxID=34012 RepID=UPI003D729789
MTEFFAMGGHAAYVWPAYAVAALMMLTVLASTLRGLRAREATLNALESGRPARRRGRRTVAQNAV